jgi:phosphoglycerate dehydrogenase-like enzyme
MSQSPLNILIDVPVVPDALERLKQIPNLNISFTDPPEERLRPLPRSLIQNQDILFCMFPPENHQDLDALKFIQVNSSGFTQLAPLRLDSAEKNVQAANSLGVFDVPIAEWCVAMLINMARNMKGLIENQENAHWDRSAQFQREIRGLTVGIWGYGGIGRQTARLCKALGLTVHVMTRTGVSVRDNIYCVENTGDSMGKLPDKVFTLPEKETFLEGLDFLIIAMPLTPNTEGIIGEYELRSLPSRAIVLNPARGPLIQEQALLRALQENWIAGAALDTHYAYPLPPDHPLWLMDNVMLTPHISGSSQSQHFGLRTWDIFVQNVERYSRSEPLLNELSHNQLAELNG